MSELIPPIGIVSSPPPEKGSTGTKGFRRPVGTALPKKPPAYPQLPIGPYETPLVPEPDAIQRALPTFRDRLISTNGTGKCVPLAYGKTRCGARLVYGEVDANQRFLTVMYVFAEGEQASLENFTIDGHTPPELGMTLGTDYNIYLGTSGQTVDPLLAAANPKHVSGHPGTCYIAARFDGQNPLAGQVNVENVLATLGGIKCRDQRLDPTLVTRYPTTNGILAVADFMTDNRYGAAYQDAGLSWESTDSPNDWTDSANDCDHVIGSQGSAPAGAPTISLGVGAGNLYTFYAYKWAFTYVTNGIESPRSPTSTPYSPPAHQSAGLVTVTTGPPGTTARRIYRNRPVGPVTDTNLYLCGEISDNVTTTFTDRVSDYQLLATVAPPAADPKRYEIGIWMGEQATLDDWLQAFRAHFAGYFSYDGKWRVFIDQARASSGLAITEDHMTTEPEISTSGTSSMWTRVIVDFTNREQNYKPDNTQIEHPNLALPANENEREEKRETTLNLYGCPSYDQAQRLAKLHFNRSRLTKEIIFTVNAIGWRLMPGLIVDVTCRKGNLSATKVIVTDVMPQDNGSSLRVRGEFYDAAMYSDTIQVNPSPIVPGPPSPYAVPADPTAIAVTQINTVGPDGLTTKRLKIAWTANPSLFTRSTRVSYNDGVNTVILGDIAGNGPAYIENPRNGVLYTITLKTVLVTQITSPGATATITVSNISAPSAVTGLTYASRFANRIYTGFTDLGGFSEDLVAAATWNVPSDPNVRLCRMRSMSSAVQATRDAATWASIGSAGETIIPVTSKVGGGRRRVRTTPSFMESIP
jgi:hypothetical protein